MSLFKLWLALAPLYFVLIGIYREIREINNTKMK
jgi:hypothetical protein